MIQRLSELKQTALRELEAVNDLPNLESWRVRYLGRKSELTNMLRGLAELPIEERKSAGALANRIKDELEAVLEQKTEVLKAESQKQTLHADESLAARGDITLPGRPDADRTAASHHRNIQRNLRYLCFSGFSDGGKQRCGT